jgi:hypothetical protein
MALATESPAAGGTSSSSSSSSPAIRILDTIFVPPSSSSLSPGPAPSDTETSLPLTFFDIFWLHSPPVERVFLYRLPPDADTDAIISNLKTSLSHAVRAFYPLAGRIRLAHGTADRYELHYRPGDGVAFTVAEYDIEVDALTADDAVEVATVAPLLPPLPEGGGMFAVQATVLTSTGRRHRGLAVGVTVHHATCDGSGSTHFLHYWAANAAEHEAPPPPVIDRSLISDPSNLYELFYQSRPTKDEMEFVKLSPDQVLATFVLSNDDLQRAKDAVAAEAVTRGVAPPRVSSLVAALGLAWSCYHRAKKEIGDGEGPTCLMFSVDHRSRIQPPLPDKYLGNCVGPAIAIASKAELTGAEGLFAACAAVAAGIQEAVTEIGTPAMDAWMDRIKEVGTTMGVLSVAGSPRFRVYEVDFGFGKPAKVDIVSVARTGALALAENRRCEGGGMEVGVSLRPDGMGRFQECFADAVSWLRARRS